MTTFALIHGAWGSGWHWASIPERLRAAGHEVVAPDMPCDDASKTFDDYTQVVLDALGDAEDVVVVGYSLGGQTAARVAVRRPVRALIYVAALVPEPGATLMEQFRARLMHREYLDGVELLDKGSRWIDRDVYRRVAYDDWVPEDVVRARFARLRPQLNTAFLHPFDADLSPARYVMCTRDRIINNDHWRTAVEVTDELDCSHSPMVSLPDELTELLLRST
jgi:pimeloyl-ACP methyl ester carboxylesterase